MPTALVILAPGFEEIEAIAPVDILRRAGVDVTVAGTVPGPIAASRQTRHLADVDLDAVLGREFDLVVLPGGAEGTANLKKDARVKAILEKQAAAGRRVGAICAAPTILLAHGLFPEAPLVCHPSEWPNVPADRLRKEARVVVSGNLVTSLAAGSAIEFGLALVGHLLGPEAVAKVNQGLCAKL